MSLGPGPSLYPLNKGMWSTYTYIGQREIYIYIYIGQRERDRYIYIGQRYIYIHIYIYGRGSRDVGGKQGLVSWNYVGPPFDHSQKV